MKKLALASAVLMALLFACTDDETTSQGEFGARCTTVTDSGSTECESGVCSNAFDQLGTVCSVKCTPGDASTCPSGSEGQKCNMKGYCKP